MSFVVTEMGLRNTKNAKKYAAAGISIFLATAAIIILLLYLFREAWADFYTNNPEVKDIMLDVLPWLVLGIILIDGF